MRVGRFRLLPLLLLCSLPIAGSGLLTAIGFAQDALSSDAHGSHAGRLAPTVNGAENPDAVPDDIAYFLFFRALASAKSPALVDGVLAAAGLQPTDRAKVGTALKPVATTAGVTNFGGGNVRGIQREAVATARVALQSSLSPEGLTALDAHVRTHVKKRIVGFRGQMPESQR